MFIVKRQSKCRTTKEISSYYRLVETVQTEKGPRQRTILYLGKLDLRDEDIKILAKILEIRISGGIETAHFPHLNDIANTLVEKYNRQIEREKGKIVKIKQADYHSIDLNSVYTETHRSFGPEFVATSYWDMLKFDEILAGMNFSKKEISLAQAVVLGRLISPGSELHTYNWFMEQSSLKELMKHDISETGKDAFYEIGDLLYSHKEVIESQLRTNLQRKFSIQDSIYLYDLTNTYFEGNKLKSSLAKHGKSKERRNDCPLVTLALVVDEYGFPVYSDIFEGNQSEPETLPKILQKIFRRTVLAVEQPKKNVVIMDRGIATKENIDYLKTNGYSFFVVERKNNIKAFKDEFVDKSDFNEFDISRDNKVYLKKILKDDYANVLVYSPGKEVKEKSIIGKKEERFIEDANRLIRSNRKGSIVSTAKINIKIGRLKERYGAIANCYDFVLDKESEQSDRVKSISILKKNQEPIKKEFGGCYVITTDMKDYSDKQIWDMYMRLNQIESAFRNLKSELGTRPIYHQLDKRIKSHLFISVLAYSILQSIEYELKENGKTSSWSTIKNVLSTHQRCTTVLKSEDDYVHRLRVTAKPEKHHKEIYSKLNLKYKPNRKHSKIKINL